MRDFLWNLTCEALMLCSPALYGVFIAVTFYLRDPRVRF